MTSSNAIPVSRNTAWADLGRAVRTFPPALLPALLAAALLCNAAKAAVPAIHWPQAATPVAKLAAQEPDEISSQHLRTRCGGCGFVESIRKVEAQGGLPAAYEFIVRMRDGSTRTSNDANPAQWRIGDRIILIGAKAPALVH